MAIALGCAFIVVTLSSPDYYKLNVYIYYALTFIIPQSIGV